MIDESQLPSDRRGRERWLAARVDEIGRLTRKRLRAMIVGSFDEFLRDALTASDLSLFDDIPSRWLTTVVEEIVPAVGETYLAGSVTAWLGLPTEPTDAFAKSWEAVANHNAESYMVNATNRLAGVGDQVWGMVKTKASNAIRDGLTNEQLRAEIQGVSRFSEFRADTIARTETVGAYVQGDMAGARALGSNGPVEKVWVATLDRRTRDDHWEADGQCVLLDAMFDVGGEQMDAPHDPNGSAGNVVNCRCYVEMLYPGDTRPDGSIVEEPEDSIPEELSIEDEPATADPVLTEREALQWYRTETASFVAQEDLSDPLWKARSDYIGGSHEAINAALRAGDLDAPMLARVHEVDAAVQGLGIPVPQNVPLFRGARFSGDLSVGDVIPEPAFMSTTPVESVAKGFAGYSDDAVLYQIEHAGVAGMPASTLESELVLPRGMAMEVTAIEPNPLGGRIVRVRLG